MTGEPDQEIITTAAEPLDPMTALAVTMQAKPGAYALLLGSGISRSAQIPTGWEIIQALIRRIAVAENEPEPTDPAMWYRERFGAEPVYGTILQQVGAAGAERSQLIKGFIEPTEDERAAGLKQPTEAHRAIADLVARGYVRVIVTTNFDRLLEQALESIGVTPSIISSADSITGTLPLAHNTCTVIKVHGDYVDARIKNTPIELDDYADEMKALLAQVFHEYGLIVCGWSGEWDTALVDCLRETQSPWFTTYWASHREPRPRVQSLVDERKGRVITNMDADHLFRRLADTVSSIEDVAQPALLSAALARATVKRYIVNPTERIRLQNLVTSETRRVLHSLAETPDGWYSAVPTAELIESRLSHYEARTATLRDIVSTGCYWGESEQRELWVGILRRLANVPRVYGSLYESVAQARLYPALLILYAAGIASVASGRYDLLRALLTDVSVEDRETRRADPLLFVVHPGMLDGFDEILIPGTRWAGIAISRRLARTPSLWTGVREELVSDEEFNDAVDRFEYLLGLEMFVLRSDTHYSGWAFAGAYAFRSLLGGTMMARRIGEEIDAMRDDWPPLKAGFFNGDLERLRSVKDMFDPKLPR